MDRLSAYVGGPAGLFLFFFFFIPWVSITCVLFPFIESTTVMNASGYELATGDSADEFTKGSCELFLGELLDMFGLNTMLADLGELSDESTGTLPMDLDEGCNDVDFEEFNTSLLAEYNADANDLDPIQADAMLWGIPLAALAAMTIAIARHFDIANSLVAGTGFILVGIAASSIFALKFLDFQDFDNNLASRTNAIIAEAQAEAAEEDPTVTVPATLTATFSYDAGFYLSIFVTFFIFVAGIIGFFEDEIVPQRPSSEIPMPDMSMFNKGQGAGSSPGEQAASANAPPPKRPSWMDD